MIWAEYKRSKRNRYQTDLATRTYVALGGQNVATLSRLLAQRDSLDPGGVHMIVANTSKHFKAIAVVFQAQPLRCSALKVRQAKNHRSTRYNKLDSLRDRVGQRPHRDISKGDVSAIKCWPIAQALDLR